MGRAPCCDKENVKKGPWSPEEDAKLKEFIEKYGIGGNWIALPQKAGLSRCGKSCRLRWLNYLRPNIKHGEFSHDEDRIICSLYATIGTRWSVMAAQLPGRTDNDIKNYWNTKLKKKFLTIPSSLPEKQTFSSSMPFQPSPPPFDHDHTSHQFLNNSSSFYLFTPNFMNHVDNNSNSFLVHDDHINNNNVSDLQSPPPPTNNLMTNCLEYLGFQDDHYSMCKSPMLMFGSTSSSRSSEQNQYYQIKQEDYQIAYDDQVLGDQVPNPSFMIKNNLEEVKQLNFTTLFHDGDENMTAYYQKGLCSYYH